MKYLTALKAAKRAEKPLPDQATKVPKGPSVTFGTDDGRHVSEKVGADPLLVECWAPAGTVVLVRADNPVHAEQIRRWNPRPRL